MHGTYDFMISDILEKISEVFGFIGLLLAILGVVLLILMIRFFLKAKSKEEYNEILLPAPQEAGEAV